jgi:hypothetical protein
MQFQLNFVQIILCECTCNSSLYEVHVSLLKGDDHENAKVGRDQLKALSKEHLFQKRWFLFVLFFFLNFLTWCRFKFAV